MSRADCDICVDEMVKLRKQIADLETALIDETSWNMLFTRHGKEIIPTENDIYWAKEQLSHEIPEIDWKDMK